MSGGLIGFAVALAGIIVAAVTASAQLRSSKTGEKDSFREDWQATVKELHEDYDRVDRRSSHLESENRDLRSENAELRKTIDAMQRKEIELVQRIERLEKQLESLT